MLVASSGDSDGNSEYVESPENLPTRLANTLQLKSNILELQHMNEVAEDNLDEITQPTELLTHPDEINPTELTDDDTTPDENDQYNGSLTPHVTQPSLPNSPLTDSSVAKDNPMPLPCVEVSDATHIVITENTPKVRLKRSDDELYGVYHDWVHQDPGKIWMVKSDKYTVVLQLIGTSC